MRITAASVLPAVLGSCLGISNAQTGVAVVVWSLPSTIPPTPTLLSLCSCGPAGVGATPLRTALPTHTQVDRPGCIAGVTQLGSPRAGKGEGAGRGSHWGIQGGLPGPAPLPLLARRWGHLLSPTPMQEWRGYIWGPQRWGHPDFKLKLFGGHVPPKLTQVNFGS